MDLFLVKLFLLYICIALSLENAGNAILYLAIDKKNLSRDPETLRNNHTNKQQKTKLLKLIGFVTFYISNKRITYE